MPRILQNLRTLMFALAIGLPAHAAEPPLPDSHASFDRTHDRNAPGEEDYPLESRRAGEEGVVYLSLLILADGSVKEIKLDRSSGFERLDDAAIDFYYEYPKFLPAVRNGKKIASWKPIKVTWKLKQREYDAEGNPVN